MSIDRHALFFSLALFAPSAALAGDKVAICHTTSSDSNPDAMINVAEAAVSAHYAHGDYETLSCIPGVVEPYNTTDDSHGLADDCVVVMIDNEALYDTETIEACECPEGYNMVCQ